MLASLTRTPDPAPSSGWRSTVSAILLVALFFTAAAANFAIWLQTTIKDEDAFVATFGSLLENPSVAELLGQSIADAAVDSEQAASDISARLPEELRPLAAPIATALNDLTADIATRLVESEAFVSIYQRMLRSLHTALLFLLDVRNRNEPLVADVEEGVNLVADRLEALGISVTVPDAPRVTLLDARQNSVLVTALRFVYTTGWVFPALFLVVAIALIAIALDRRRSVVLFGVVTAIAMAFDLIVMRILRSEVSDQAVDRLVAEAVQSAWDTVTSRARWQTWIVLAAGLIAAAVAHYAGAGTKFPFGAYPSAKTAAFLTRWGTAVEVAVIVGGLLVLLLVPSVTFGLALIVAAMAAAILYLVSEGKRGERVSAVREEPV